MSTQVEDDPTWTALLADRPGRIGVPELEGFLRALPYLGPGQSVSLDRFPP
jgi:hypothetical protein